MLIHFIHVILVFNIHSCSQQEARERAKHASEELHKKKRDEDRGGGGGECAVAAVSISHLKLFLGIAEQHSTQNLPGCWCNGYLDA